jgi:glycine C-acetyltransferase
VMFGDAERASAAAEQLLEGGVYAVAFSYPVVPMGRARIRTQLSAALSDDDVGTAIAAFSRVAAR